MAKFQAGFALTAGQSRRDWIIQPSVDAPAATLGNDLLNPEKGWIKCEDLRK